jgi:GntR family transcriptional repressor for pyruvate dehydrogenase complex
VALTDDAIAGIKQMLVSGELGPGDRLPREDELAARLGLSRNSLREAVRALTLVRILDVRQGDGTYVTSLRPDVLLDAVSFVSDFHQDDSVLDFLEVRRILEPAAVAMAARLATPEDIAGLWAAIDECADSLPWNEFVELDKAFHQRVVGLCGNRVLVSLLDSLAGPSHRARVWRGITETGVHSRTRNEHRAIVSAIEGRQPDVAAARAVVHIAGVEDWLRRAVADPDAKLRGYRY